MLAFSVSNFTFLEECDAFCDFNSIPSTCDPTGVSLECADALMKSIQQLKQLFFQKPGSPDRGLWFIREYYAHSVGFISLKFC